MNPDISLIFIMLEAALASYSVTRHQLSFLPNAHNFPMVMSAVRQWATNNGLKMVEEQHSDFQLEVVRVLCGDTGIVVIHRPRELHSKK